MLKLNKNTKKVFLGLVIIVITGTAFFLIKENRENNLLEKQADCVKSYNSIKPESIEPSLDNTGVKTVKNHVLYSKKEKSCLEAIEMISITFKDKKTVGYYLIEDIYTGKRYLFNLFADDSQRNIAKQGYKNRLEDLEVFGMKE